MRRLFLAGALALSAATTSAATPDEIVADAALEARARALGRELRCMVCQNQSVEDSNSALAHDLRVLLRERLIGGDSDEAAMGYIAARYGDFVLLKPPIKTLTAFLWAGPLLFLLGALALFLRLLRREATVLAPLSAAEEARLTAMLDE
ncbi:cytochrome c-type biogenesis protein CcmH [Methylocystis sp. JAN1]|uniref:cytochrome c-type biogenesis protein n=1 Tax=Methylocystis sp. JAN1 TaxID=3397211 RepID=UPI003FA20E5B